jgi:hypothetical protein
VGLTGLARKTVAGCVESINQLDEQGADATLFPVGCKMVGGADEKTSVNGTKSNREPSLGYRPFIAPSPMLVAGLFHLLGPKKSNRPDCQKTL